MKTKTNYLRTILMNLYINGYIDKRIVTTKVNYLKKELIY